jgi:UDP-N-acetylglucosamine acyltransferase
VAKIDSTARVADGAKLGADVEIGPYCIIGPDVTLGDGCRLASHISIQGNTSIGPGAKILPFASLGTPPQSVHYKGEPAKLIVGANCDIREHVTMNIGTAGGRMETRVGNNCMFMVGSHIGHDCVVGDNVIFANHGTLGGHAEVGDSVFVGGFGGVHQNTRVGEGAMLAGIVAHRHDVIPYGITAPNGRLAGLNLIGLKRRNFSRQTIHTLRAAYRDLFFGEGNLSERTDIVAEKYDEPAVQKIIEFIRSAGKRRLITPRTRGNDGGED